MTFTLQKKPAKKPVGEPYVVSEYTGDDSLVEGVDSILKKDAPVKTQHQKSKANGLLEAGNIDLSDRPTVKNSDGSFSTVYSMSIEEDGKHILIPRVSDDGRILTEQEAIDNYHNTKKHLGIFNSEKSATIYAKKLHEQQQKQYSSSDTDLLEGIKPIAESTSQFKSATNNQDSELLDGIDSILPKDAPSLGEFGEPDEDVVRVSTPNPNLKKEIPIEYEDLSNKTSVERYAAFSETPWTVPVKSKNPYALLKARKVEISTVFEQDSQGNKLPVPANESVKPNQNEIIDSYLSQIDPELAEARNRYRKETGRELVHLDSIPNLEFKDGKWYAEVSMPEATARVVNAYAKYGLAAARDEGRKVTNEYKVYAEEYNREAAKIEQFVKDHPYVTAASKGFEGAKLGYLQLIHNTEKLGDALIISAKYGFDSEQYRTLMDEDRKQQEAINFMASNVPEINATGAGALESAVTLAGKLPIMIAPGEAFPFLVFLENANRGATEATRNAFMILPMMGIGRALGELTTESVQAANFSLASRALRQAEVRLGQGATQTLTEFATNPSAYLNGDKPFNVVENYDSEHGLFREGSLERGIGSFLTGAAFPVGKAGSTDMLPQVSHVDDIIAGQLPPARLEIPLDNRTEPVFSELERGSWNGNWDDVVLNYLELKRNAETESYRTGNLQHDVSARSNIEHNVEVLEGIIPKEWIDYVSKHEDVIRAAKRGGQQRQEFRQRVAEMRAKGQVSTDAEKLSVFDVADWAKEGHSILGDLGDNNRFVMQHDVARDLSAARESLNQQSRIESRRASGERGAIGPFKGMSEGRISNRWYNENKPRFTRIGAFYIEAGIRDYYKFSERLALDLGSDIYTRLSDKQVKSIYESSLEFQQTNNITPQLSDLKNAIIEGFPDGNISADNAIEIATQLESKEGIKQTEELAKYLYEAKENNKVVNKNKLLQIITNNQKNSDTTMATVAPRKIQSILPREEFNQNLKAVVDSFEPEVNPETGTVLDSGLPPAEFAYQARTFYSDAKDYSTFAQNLVSEYGERVRPYLEKLWNFAREFHENEGGWIRNPFFGKEKEIKELGQEERSNIAKSSLYNTVRSITLANINPYFRRVYEGMRDIRLMLNGYSSVLIQQLHDARALAGYKYKGIISANPEVAKAIFDLNETGARTLKQYSAQNPNQPIPVGAVKVYWDDNYLRSHYFFDNDEIAAFRKIRQAQNDILNLRMKQELYHVQRSLNNLTVNSLEYNAAQARIQEIKNRYQTLRDTGYVSLQRRGKFAIYAEDPTVPVGKPDRIVYVHAKTKGEANNIVKDFKRQGLTNIDVGRIQRFSNDLSFMRKLTPGQLEDFLTASGANRQDPEIANLRKEIYSRYASFAYQIERNLTRGYKTSWKNLLDTMVNQAKTYSSSFYADIGRENALDMLDQSGIRQYRVSSTDSNGNVIRKNFNDRNAALNYRNSLTSKNHTNIEFSKPDVTTYNITKSYIEDETTPSSRNIFNRAAAKTRAITYITQMGLDVSQFFINLTQPFILTYPQLAKVGLTGIKPEFVLAKAWSEVPQLLNFERKLESARRSGLGLSPKSNLPQDMKDMFVRALNEDVVKAELTTAYASSQLGLGSKTEKVADITSIFARAGEHVTRTNAFSAFYHAGKSKGLSGNSLYNFIVQNIKETHGESSYGEAPRIIRMGGEGARLFYQFGSFNQMWWENLATAIKTDVQQKRPLGATSRQLGAMGVFAGIIGLPITAGIRAGMAAFYGRDQAKNIEEETKKKLSNISPEYAETLKNIALYGISGKKGVSSRLGMRIPIIDSLADINAGTVDILDSIPAYTTIGNVISGFTRDNPLIHRGTGFRFAEDLSPRAARNIFRSFRFASEGARERPEFGKNNGDIIVPKGKFVRDIHGEYYDPSNWTSDTIYQLFGVTPTEVTNEYEKKKYKELGTTAKRTKKSLRRFYRQYLAPNAQTQ